MQRPTTGLEAELRLSPKLVWIAFALTACVVYAVAEVADLSWDILDRVFTFVVFLFGAAIGGWLVETWHPLAGRWAALAFSGAAVYALFDFLDIPSALLLAAVPVALATPLLGIWASLVASLVMSVLHTLVLRFASAGLAGEVYYLSMVGIWATLAVMFVIHRQTYRLLTWLQGYFEQSQHHVEEARGQKAELEQTLEGYASVTRQLALANERATALRVAAEDAHKAKAAFVANVSHEFRTPLNMIIGLADLMLQAPETYNVLPSPEMSEDLEVIHRNCEHLANMVNDVLDLTRLEAGRLSLHRERVDLGKIIYGSVDVVRPLISKKQLTMTAVIPESLPPVSCDPTRIQQVILNVISNAARFTDKGGIDICVEHDDLQVTVRVSDTGMGIAPEELDVIFQPFEQGETWPNKGGSGLGLSLSKRFVELHGGSVHLESTLGKGTVFCFTLPILAPVELLQTPSQAVQREWVWREPAYRASQRVSLDRLAKPCVVLYDEGGQLRLWLDHYREQAEFVVVEGPDELSRVLRSCLAHAVLLCAAEPDSLVTLARQARDAAHGIPVLVCSIPRHVDRVSEAGAIGHLLKPVRRDDFAAAISSLGSPVRRVLVVDDDPEVVQLFSRILAVVQDDLEVITASCGKEALERMRDASPDLVLLDVLMPGMNGWDVLAAAKADADITSIPVLLTSAQDTTDQSLSSSHLLITLDGGIPLSRVLAVASDLTPLLYSPDPGPHPAPE